MIDIHAHILDGIDDGSPDMETSLALLRMAAVCGTTDIIATPHVIESTNHLGWELIKEKTENLNRNAAKAGIPIRVYAGAELEMNWDIMDLVQKGREDYCLAGSRYVLVELPANSIPNYADEFLYEAQLRDLTPIIAHPERNACLMKDPRILHQWVKKGVLVQCNTGSFTGKFGRHAKAQAELLLQNKLVHFLGTDAHRLEYRNTDTRDALETISRAAPVGTEQTIACTNPQAILKNNHLVVSVPAAFTIKEEKNKGLLARLFSL